MRCSELVERPFPTVSTSAPLLICRRSRAALELPTRLARCHSPFEFWSAQAQFMQEGFADCQSVALRMMTGPLHALSNGRQ